MPAPSARCLPISPYNTDRKVAMVCNLRVTERRAEEKQVLQTAVEANGHLPREFVKGCMPEHSVLLSLDCVKEIWTRDAFQSQD